MKILVQKKRRFVRFFALWAGLLKWNKHETNFDLKNPDHQDKQIDEVYSKIIQIKFVKNNNQYLIN